MPITTVETMPLANDGCPDPMVRPARQVYPAAYKLKVLAELDAAGSKSERGEILRREGLYWSVVSEWRKQRDRGALEAMRQKHPGRKGDPVRAENARLRAQVEDLEGRLSVAEELIGAQGKVSALLQQHSRRSAEQK
jgi:transposase-like protein